MEQAQRESIESGHSARQIIDPSTKYADIEPHLVSET